MTLICTLDLPAAQQLWSARDESTNEGYERASKHQDPVQFLAAQSAFRKLCVQRLHFDVQNNEIHEEDFWLESLNGEHVVVAYSEKAEDVLNRHLLSGLDAYWVDQGQALGLRPVEMLLPVSRAGRIIGTVFAYRRKIIEQNMARVYGERITSLQLRRLVLAHYSHLATLLRELLLFRFKTPAERAACVRVEGVEVITEAFNAGRGMLVLTGHFGNFEVSTVSGIEHFPQAKGRIHFLRRPIKPKWLSDLLTRRFNQAGFGVIGRRGSLEEIVDRLESGEAIVFPFDQYARKPEGIETPLFGVPAGTYKSMAVLAMATGAPVIPASSWREPDGSHVLRFAKPLDQIEDEDVGREIALNTAQYNRALERLILRKPAQWWWVHRRWKNLPTTPEG